MTKSKKSTKKSNVVGIFQAALKVVCKTCKAKVGKPCVYTVTHRSEKKIKGHNRPKPHRIRLSAVRNVKLAPAKKIVLKAKVRKVTAINKKRAA